MCLDKGQQFKRKNSHRHYRNFHSHHHHHHFLKNVLFDKVGYIQQFEKCC